MICNLQKLSYFNKIEPIFINVLFQKDFLNVSTKMIFLSKSQTILLTVSGGSYLNPVASDASLKVQNCQIWQSGTETSEIRGNRGVKFWSLLACRIFNKPFDRMNTLLCTARLRSMFLSSSNAFNFWTHFTT